MKEVTSLKRGLEILRLLNEDGVRQVRDLHAATGLPKSTIVRMVDTLVAAGYVMREDDNGVGLTARVLSLSKGFDAAGSLLRVASPVIARVRDEHAWPVDLAVFDRDAMVILATGGSPGTMSLNRPHGSRLPMLVTALGRAYLAFCPAEERARTLDLLAASGHPLDAAARDAAAVARILDETRRNGYAVNNREHLKTTRAVAVPVLVDGRPVACISMMVVASAMTMEEAVKSFVPPLWSAARTVADGLVRRPAPHATPRRRPAAAPP